MRIGIDARFYGPEGTGIGRYVEKLLENLEILDQKNDYFVFLRKANFFLYNPKNPLFQKIKADARWYSVKEQIIMPAALSGKKLDLVHFPHFNIPLLYSGKFVVTIHDLTISDFSSKDSSTSKAPLRLTKQAMYNLTIRAAVKRAEKIFTPSNFVKKEIVKKLNIKSEKIIVTYESAEDFSLGKKFSEGKIKEVFAKYSIREPFIVYVGTAYPHKNIGRLLEGFQKTQSEIKLVFVSEFNPFTEKVRNKVREMGLAERFVATGSIPDKDLGVLLQKAICLVQPSLSEGFGLPGLEAMESLCPVVCSEKSSLPEIYGESALYFNPMDIEDIAEKIDKIYSSKELRNKLKSLGKEQAKKYSWKVMAQKTLQTYEEVYEKTK